MESMNKTEVARMLVLKNPGLDVEAFLSRVRELGLESSKHAFYAAAREWREARGLGPLPNGGSASPHPVNYVDPSVFVVSTAQPSEATERVVKQLLGYKRSKAAEPQRDTLKALAELVWEWMDENNCKAVTFSEDGSVRVEDKPVVTRSFSLVKEEA